MSKPIAPPTRAIRPHRQLPVVDEMLPRRQFFTDRLDLFHPTLGTRRHCRRFKRQPHHTRHLEHVPCRWREFFNTPQQQLP